MAFSRLLFHLAPLLGLVCGILYKYYYYEILFYLFDSLTNLYTRCKPYITKKPSLEIIELHVAFLEDPDSDSEEVNEGLEFFNMWRKNSDPLPPNLLAKLKTIYVTYKYSDWDSPATKIIHMFSEEGQLLKDGGMPQDLLQRYPINYDWNVSVKIDGDTISPGITEAAISAMERFIRRNPDCESTLQLLQKNPHLILIPNSQCTTCCRQDDSTNGLLFRLYQQGKLSFTVSSDESPVSYVIKRECA